MSKHKSDQNSDMPQGEESQEMLEHPSYEELLQKLNEAEQKADQHWERVLRMQADAKNAEQRAKRELDNAYKYALDKFVNGLLPVVDSLELCLTSVPADMQKAAASVIEGVQMTLKMFLAELEKAGVQQVNPVNEPFNPETQQAISMVPSTELAPGTVVSVLQKGYTLNQRMVRPAMVVVAKAPE